MSSDAPVLRRAASRRGLGAHDVHALHEAPRRGTSLDDIADRLADATRVGEHRPRYDPGARLPVGRLLLLAAAGFITMLTEALPVPLMRSIHADTGWSDGAIGQLVTAYALGCCLAALPMTLATRAANRRPLLLVTLLVFVVTNTLTMATTFAPLMLAARFVAGASAGLTWAILAGCATRLARPEIAGRAMALAMAGTPLALAFGIPLGSALGSAIGWRGTFVAISVGAAIVLVLGYRFLPDMPGEPRTGSRPSASQVLARPGLWATVIVTGLFACGHNIAYTFVPTFLEGRTDLNLGALLLFFGLAATVGLAVVGRTIDAELPRLLVGSCAALAVVLFVLGPIAHLPAAVVTGLFLAWGLVFGGAPTLVQTASARLTGEAQDVGQAVLVTTWNGCVALAAAVGGLLVNLGLSGVVCLVGAALALVAAFLSGRVNDALYVQWWKD